MTDEKKTAVITEADVSGKRITFDVRSEAVYPIAGRALASDSR